MKINIGPYLNWVGPYQIAEKILFWKDKNKDESVYKFGEWLNETPLKEICNYIHRKKKRNIKIHIDNHDVWSLDFTLALIIHPALKKLKSQKHGSALVDDEDVPINIRSSSAPPKEHDWDTDAFVHARWDYVLDEMIWAFGEIVNDTWETQYHSGNPEFVWIPVDADGNRVTEQEAKLFSLEKPGENIYSFDRNGYTAHHAKIQNGLRLFAKYYFGLWD
jgi:hypothetical protein